MWRAARSFLKGCCPIHPRGSELPYLLGRLLTQLCQALSFALNSLGHLSSLLQNPQNYTAINIPPMYCPCTHSPSSHQIHMLSYSGTHGQPAPYGPAGAQLPPLLSLLTQRFAALLSPQGTHTLCQTSLLPQQPFPLP